MKPRTHLYIDIFGLAEGQHKFSLEAGDELFEQFPNDVVQHGQLQVAVMLDKSATLIRLFVHVTGKVTLTCDRSLRPFDRNVEVKEVLTYKFGEDEGELTDEIIIISPGTQRLMLEQPIYDFVMLSLPVKKIHPDLRNEPLQETADGQALLIASTQTDEDEQEGGEEKAVDPRFDILKKLKDNLN